MKKTFIVLAMVVAMSFGLVGCHDDSQSREVASRNGSSFIVVEEGLYYSIVYHKETKVMYTMSVGDRNKGNFELLVNADGSPMLYEGE